MIVPWDFTEKSGELTPTLKLKRGAVMAKYEQLVERLYEEPQ